MVRRLALVAAAAALTMGLIAPTTASAAEDPDYGWDYRPLSIGGSNYQMLFGQFAGDGATDIVFYAPGTTADSLWIGKTGTKGANGFTKVPLSINGTYVPTVGDFGGDDYDDIMMYGRGAASDALLVSTDTSSYFTSKTVKISGTNYQPKVLKDFRGPGAKDDIVFLGPGDVADYLWHFNEQLGTTDYDAPSTWVSKTLKVNGSYQLVPGDYNGDGLDDLVLYQPGTKADYKWLSTAAGTFTQTSLSINGTYQAVVVRHEVNDGIYFWASGATNEVYWTSSGSSFTSRTTAQYPVTGTAKPYGVNGILIQSDGARDAFVFADGTSAESFYLANPNHDFGTASQAAFGNFDGDTTFDTVWYGPGTRPDEVWYGLAASDAAARSMDRSAPAAATPTPSADKVTPFTVR